MAKVKYFYNPHKLSFEKVRTSIFTKLLRVFGFISASVVAGGLFLIIAYTSIDSPKEKQLKREIRNYQLQIDLMNKKVGQLAVVLDELQEKDANIYRAIFEADPIPGSVRQGGFGGVEKYKHLEGYLGSDDIIAVQKKIDLMSSQVYVQSKSFDELAKLASKKTEFIASIPAIQPISNKKLRSMASGFGYRLHPVYKTHKMHTGIDFTAPTGTPIYATGNGTVGDVELGHRGYGNHVIISHGFGYQTLYAHMKKVVAKPGKKVKRGELIGYIGSTGTSTAPHLHYEVIKNGKKINPINYFFNDLSPQEYEQVREIASRPTQSFD